MPFGALPLGESVTLSIDVWDEPEASAELHLWVEDEAEENGGHEKLVPMERSSEPIADGGIRFTVSYAPKKADVLWYSFNVTAANGDVWRYGAREGSQVGEGAFAYGVPPSFQITVYDRKREVLPTWYKDAIVYQIFPDRFARDENWRERAEASIDPDHKGIPRRIVDDWNTYPRYDRHPSGVLSLSKNVTPPELHFPLTFLSGCAAGRAGRMPRRGRGGHVRQTRRARSDVRAAPHRAPR